MLKSEKFLKYFRVHSKQIDIFKKARFISIWNKYVWLYKHADFESIIYKIERFQDKYRFDSW